MCIRDSRPCAPPPLDGLSAPFEHVQDEWVCELGTGVCGCDHQVPVCTAVRWGWGSSGWCKPVCYGPEEVLWGEIQFSPLRKVAYFNFTVFVLAKQFFSFQDPSTMTVAFIYFSLRSKLKLEM